MSHARSAREFMVRNIPKLVSKETRAVALHVLSGVVMRTPVDTGRARGNWNTALGVASGRVSDSRDPGGGNTVAAGSRVIGGHRDFQQIVIDNNLPYITRLNDGHSRQAPAGFVEAVIASVGAGRRE